jgi:hypothetical protein
MIYSILLCPDLLSPNIRREKAYIYSSIITQFYVRTYTTSTTSGELSNISLECEGKTFKYFISIMFIYTFKTHSIISFPTYASPCDHKQILESCHIFKPTTNLRAEPEPLPSNQLMC